MPDNPQLASDTSIDGVFKNVYEAYRIKAFPMITPLLAQIKKGKAGGPRNMRFSGRTVFWDVVLGQPTGMVASSSGFFGKHAKAREQQAQIGIKRLYVTKQIDKLAAASTESSEGSYTQLARGIVEEAIAAAKLGQQEFLHGDGRAIKALVKTVTDNNTIVVDSPYGISSAGQGGLLLASGMYIAVLDTSASDAVLGRATISSISHSGDDATLELDTDIVGMAATDKVVVCTASDTSLDANPNGLTNSLNVGGSYNNFLGINNATAGNERWNTTRLTAGTDTSSAADVDELDIWELVQRVAMRSGEDAFSKPSDFLLLTTPGLYKKVGQSFLGQRRFTAADMMDIKGGFKALNVNGVPLVMDGWCPAGKIYLIHLPSMTWVDLLDWTKLQFEDSGVWRPIAGRDAYEVDFGSYVNFGPLNRISHGLIAGYTDTARYSHVI